MGMSRRLTIVAVLLVSLARTDFARAGGATAQQRSWALAASALLTERNGERHDRLAGSDLTTGEAERVRRLLTDWWDVTDRRGLLDALKWIQNAGHRERFARMGEQLAILTAEQRHGLASQRQRDFRLNQMIGVVEMHYARLGAKSLLGWDFSRYISICRWGYAAGYLTEDEAWARIIPAARVLRHSFTSWRELGENYLIGRQFWSPDEHVRTGHLYRQAFDRLLADPASPWNRVPWQVDFGPPP